MFRDFMDDLDETFPKEVKTQILHMLQVIALPNVRQHDPATLLKAILLFLKTFRFTKGFNQADDETFCKLAQPTEPTAQTLATLKTMLQVCDTTPPQNPADWNNYGCAMLWFYNRTDYDDLLDKAETAFNNAVDPGKQYKTAEDDARANLKNLAPYRDLYKMWKASHP